MGISTKSILSFIGLLLAYLLFWPVDAEPVAWTPPTAPEMNDQFEPNDYFQDVEILGLNDGIGPEDIAIDGAGNMYAGYDDGRIIKYDTHGNEVSVFVNTRGRPLGMDFDKKGNLIIADAEKGLLSADKNYAVKKITYKVCFPEKLEIMKFP